MGPPSAVALADGSSVASSSPSASPTLRLGSSDRGGLPSASRRTASSSAGSTTQVTVRSPELAPKSTSERSRPPWARRLGPAGEVVDRAVVGVEELVAQRDHDRRRLLAGPGVGHQREERAGPAVGGRRRGRPAPAERVHAEPVDAGGVRVQQPARDAEAVRRGLARRELVDGVLVPLVGDPVADHGVGRASAAASASCSGVVSGSAEMNV